MGLLELKFRFDPTHHVPENTHLSEYMQEVQKNYPSLGSDAAIIIGKINYTQEMPKVIALAERINSTDFIHQIDAWPLDFKHFVDVHYPKLGKSFVISPECFCFSFLLFTEIDFKTK